MLTQRLANLVFTTALLLACIYFALVAQGFEAAGLLASSGLPSKFFPQLMLGGTALCAIVVFVTYLVRGGAGGDDTEQVFEDVAAARRGLLTLLVSVACYFIWSNFGFISMAVVMGPLCLLAMGIRSISLYVIVLALTACIYLVFTELLGIQLP